MDSPLTPLTLQWSQSGNIRNSKMAFQWFTYFWNHLMASVCKFERTTLHIESFISQSRRNSECDHRLNGQSQWKLHPPSVEHPVVPDVESAGILLLKNSVTVITSNIKASAYSDSLNASHNASERASVRADARVSECLFFVTVTVFSQREKRDGRVSPLLISKNKIPICLFILLFWSLFLKDNALFNYFRVTSTPHCQKKPSIFLWLFCCDKPLKYKSFIF